MDALYHYRWVGVNRTGQTVHGTLEAHTRTCVKIRLYQQGVHTKKITRTRASLFNRFKSTRIKSQHLTHAARSLAALLKAQIPLTHALQLLQANENNRNLKNILKHIQTDVQAGLPLAQALQKHPRTFNRLFYHMVHIGERSGTLIKLLMQLAIHREKHERLQKKIHASLIYPVTILCVACFVTLGLLLFVVPEFQILFVNFNASLPAATRYLIHVSSLLKTHGLLLLLILFSSSYALRRLCTRSNRLTKHADCLLLRLPILSRIARLTIFTRLTQTLSILLSAGMPLVEALGICTQLTHNHVYMQGLKQIQTQLTEGYSLQQALETSALFPSVMTQLVGMGEASGRLETMLAHLADQQNETLDHTMQSLSGLFEPFLMALLGFWIGGLIVALYLPIFQLGGLIS